MVNLYKVEKPRSNSGPIPPNVVAPMVLTIKRSNGDLLTQSSSSAAKYLNCEVKVMDGPHAGEFFYPKLTVEGPEPGHETATGISLALIGSIVRSAFGYASNDMSPEVEAKLANFDFEDLDHIHFIGKTGKVEKGKLRDPSAGPNSEKYDDKTTLACGVTPDMASEWAQWKDAPRGLRAGAGAQSVGGGQPPGAAVSSIAPPAWADD